MSKRIKRIKMEVGLGCIAHTIRVNDDDSVSLFFTNHPDRDFSSPEVSSIELVFRDDSVHGNPCAKKLTSSIERSYNRARKIYLAKQNLKDLKGE